MTEILGIAAELAANRAKYARYAYVAPHDRVFPVIAPEPIEAPKEAEPPPARPTRVRITQPYVRPRGSNNWWKPERKGARERISDVIATTADVFGVTVDDLLSPSRKQRIAHPRFAAMHILHKVLRLSQPTIGTVLKRDHTTVLSGVRRAAMLRRADIGFAGRSRQVARELRQLWSARPDQ